MSAHLSENAKHAADALSIMTVVATLAEWLPAVAALASLIWSMIRIWETKTVQTWAKKFKK
jgi:hypothetical protein